MQKKHGGIVAIEPKTGELLALVSAPSFDPALLVGRDRSKNYTALYNDSIAKPLYDRTLLAEYPPGSPFKVVNALIGLQKEKALDERQHDEHRAAVKGPFAQRIGQPFLAVEPQLNRIDHLRTRPALGAHQRREIGRASCRERV